MNCYSLSFGWQITVPNNWCEEYDEQGGQWVFYPDDSSLTVRVTPFHAERDGVPAPSDVMKNVYINTIPATAIPRNTDAYNLDGFASRIYDGTIIEHNQTVYVTYIGYYAEGELLSVNIFGESIIECKQALNIIKIMKK